MNNPDVLTTTQIFVSLQALRIAHTRLIEARREIGDTPELLADIAAFYGKVRLPARCLM